MPTSDNTITKLTIILLAGLILVSAGVSIAADSDLDARLKSDLNYLCSPELAGRNVPGPNGDRTALWVAEQFLDIGLHPLIGDTSYIQKVTLVQAWLHGDWSRVNPKPTYLTLRGPLLYDPDRRWGSGYSCRDGFCIFPKHIAPVDTTFEIAWCSYGIVDEPSGRNDFAGATGKAAMVLPGSDLPPGKAGRQALVPFKAAAAKRAGAGMLLVFDFEGEFGIHRESRKAGIKSELQQRIDEALNRPLIDLPDSEPDFPIAYLDDPMFMGLFIYDDSNKAIDIESYIKKAEQHGGMTAGLRVTFKDRTETHGYNVIGKIEGSVDEYVVIGAHYDHLGIVEGDEQDAYYPGADDNASGVAGLLEICRRRANRKTEGRGLIAVAFTAEEDGLLGSRWFVDHLPVPKESIIAMVNLDGIGRRGFDNMRSVHQPDAIPDPRYAAAYYSAASPELKDILHGAGSGVDLELNIQPVNSFSHFGDSCPFHEAHIPTVNLFSGFHKDYHSPTDTPDKIDYEKMSRIIDLSDALLNILAEDQNRIGFDPSIKVKAVIPH